MIKRVIKSFLKIVKEFYFLLEWGLRFIFIHKRYESIDEIAENIIVIGNGPSLNELDLELLNDGSFEFLCVNFFGIDETKFFSIRPKYYCIIDPIFYNEIEKQNYPQIAQLEKIFLKVDWDMNIICLHNQTCRIDNKYIKSIRINSYLYRGNWNKVKYFLYRNNLASYSYQNVINAAIYYLITAKAKTIALAGVDNDWHKELKVNIDNEVIREVNHFYGTELINVIEKGEINKGELYKYFYWYYITLYSYYEASNYSKAREVKILNLSENSYIDVFEKITVEKLQEKDRS